MITVQPVSLTVTNGDSATFSVSASGTEPLAYQWQFEGMNLPDATNSSLTIVPVEPADTGFYSVIVSNVAGTRASEPARLTVLPKPADFRITSIRLLGEDVRVSWATFGGLTNIVQVGRGVGNSTFSFSNRSEGIVVPGTGPVTGDYVDFGGTSNAPIQYYRIRLQF